MLLIDNSNTRTKMSLAEGESLTSWRAVIETEELNEESLQEVLKDVSFTQAVICSVVPEKEKLIAEALAVPVHCVSSESTLSVELDYPKPSQIGADRLANAEAGFKKYGAPCIIIDSGTAVTFDVIKSPGSYAGGVISPGLGLMTSYFLEKTALLPELVPEEPQRFIGQSTLEAMNIGALTGFRGLIKEILAGIQQELGGEARVVATGGEAALLFNGVEAVEVLDRHLTLEGILRIGLLNQDKFSHR